MATVTEIAPDLFRISIYAPQGDLQFNQFLLRDEQPLLYHTGMRGIFPQVREAVATVIDPSRLRWIASSHFEADECGALNDWLALAPEAQALCSFVGAVVDWNDFAVRPPRPMARDERLETGKHRLRFLPTPHLPHGWDASLLFEETRQTLFCSDLFFHDGDPEPLTESDVAGRTRRALTKYQAGPLRDSMVYQTHTKRQLEELAALGPKTLAIMHGSSFAGDGAQALRDLAEVVREVFGAEEK